MSLIRKYAERCNKWTEEEDGILMEKYCLADDLSELESILHRTKKQITCRAHRLHLRRSEASAKQSMMRAAKERSERQSMEKKASLEQKSDALLSELADVERQIDEGFLTLPQDKLRELVSRRSVLSLRADKESINQYANIDTLYK